jgi:hypothetical protein
MRTLQAAAYCGSWRIDRTKAIETTATSAVMTDRFLRRRTRKKSFGSTVGPVLVYVAETPFAALRFGSAVPAG